MNTDLVIAFDTASVGDGDGAEVGGAVVIWGL